MFYLSQGEVPTCPQEFETGPGPKVTFALVMKECEVLPLLF
jgi:hypothetical protein